MLETAFDDNTIGRTWTSERFYEFKHGETAVQDLSAQIVPPQAAKTFNHHQ
jgi:hypothetical protein